MMRMIVIIIITIVIIIPKYLAFEVLKERICLRKMRRSAPVYLEIK
jgi:hypothetical protein